MKKSEGIFFQQTHRLTSNPLPAVLGCDIHPYRGAPITRIEVKEINATDSGVFLTNDQPQLIVFVDIAGSGRYIFPQILLRQRIVICPIRPYGSIVLPTIEKRQIGRFYFSQRNMHDVRFNQTNGQRNLFSWGADPPYFPAVQVRNNAPYESCYR